MNTTKRSEQVISSISPTQTPADAYPAGRAAVRKLSVRVADTVQSMEELRPVWMIWANGLDTDIDYCLHSVRSDPATRQPYVVTVYEGAEPQAMLVGRIRERRLSTVVAFMDLRGPKARVLEIAPGGRLGRESEEIDRLLVRHLMEVTKTAVFDLISFQRLPLHSSLFRELRRARGLRFKVRVPNVFEFSVVPLAAAAGGLPHALSGKNRREVQRKSRILERAFPGQVSFRCFCDAAELEQGLHQAAAVAVASWQLYLASRPLSVDEAQAKFKVLRGVGQVRVYMMYLGDKPVAFLVGQQYGPTFYCRDAGFDFGYHHYSVGSLLTAWAMQDVFDRGAAQVDLGEGDQEHNRRLGAKVSEEGTVHVYAPSPRGFYLNLFFGITMAIRAVGRHGRSGLRLQRLARAWSQFFIRRRQNSVAKSGPRS